jgi:hypothetical protein
LTITTLSPNPCTTYLNINSKEKYQKYKIFNIQGVLIKSGALDTTEVINTQSLYTGLYIVQLISQEKIETIKIQKE